MKPLLSEAHLPARRRGGGELGMRCVSFRGNGWLGDVGLYAWVILRIPRPVPLERLWQDTKLDLVGNRSLLQW